MLKDVTVSFTCNTNGATLLMTLYDIITQDHLTDLDDSITALDNLSWLVDVVGDAAARVLPSMEESSVQVSEQLRKLAALYGEQVE